MSTTTTINTDKPLDPGTTCNNEETPAMQEEPKGPGRLLVRVVANGFVVTTDPGVDPVFEHVARDLDSLVALIRELYSPKNLASETEDWPEGRSITGSCSICGKLGIIGTDIEYYEYGRKLACMSHLDCTAPKP